MISVTLGSEDIKQTTKNAWALVAEEPISFNNWSDFWQNVYNGNCTNRKKFLSFPEIIPIEFTLNFQEGEFIVHTERLDYPEYQFFIRFMHLCLHFIIYFLY